LSMTCAGDRLRLLELGNPKGLYGAERWILAIMRYIDRDKIVPWVATIRDDPHQSAPLCAEAEKMGCITHIFECLGRYNSSAVSLLRSFILENRIDVLHTHGYKTDLIGLMAVRGTGCRIVSTPHGWTKQPDFKLWCFEMLDRMIFPLIDAVVPLSEDLYKGLTHVPGMGSNLHFIRNGVDVSEIEAVQNKAEELLTWKQRGDLVIGYMGRLTAGKGLDILLNALALSGHQDWRVAIIGEGEYRDELLSLAKDLGISNRVKFFGYRPDRLSFLKGFDLFVLPSRSEGIPRCVMESMAARIPVIATDIPGCRYLIEHLKTGMLFPMDNSVALVEAVERITSDPALRGDISACAYEYINDKYSAARMAREYEDLFLTLVNDQG